MNKAIFLDRDGTLIKEKNYINNPNDVELETTVIPALKKLTQAGYDLIIITNQSGIARKLVTLAQFQAIQTQLKILLKKEGIKIKDTYYCPHHPKENCPCRKPAPGLITKALKDHNIDPKKSFIIGDKPSDIQAGQNAGIKAIQVKTGHGSADQAANNLLEAVNQIIKVPLS